MKIQLYFFSLLFIVVILSAGAAGGFDEQAKFVGSAACVDCHPDEYDRFMASSDKAKSGKGVVTMSGDLTQSELESCYKCHVTGYGQPGGFVSFESTPDLGHAGCEVCHGPGSLHVEYGGDPEYIEGSLDLSKCAACHDDPRVRRINYKPLLYSSAH